VALFSESAARAVVTVAPEDEERLFELAAEHGVPITSLGETRGDALAFEGVFEVPLEELRGAWTRTLPAALA
jgi:phosphoribosylformylglycinamidine synthase